MGDNIQNMIENKNKIVAMNGSDISLEKKVENDGRSEIVFGQSVGELFITIMNSLAKRNHGAFRRTPLGASGSS